MTARATRAFTRRRKAERSIGSEPTPGPKRRDGWIRVANHFSTLTEERKRLFDNRCQIDSRSSIVAARETEHRPMRARRFFLQIKTPVTDSAATATPRTQTKI